MHSCLLRSLTDLVCTGFFPHYCNVYRRPQSEGNVKFLIKLPLWRSLEFCKFFWESVGIFLNSKKRKHWLDHETKKQCEFFPRPFLYLKQNFLIRLILHWSHNKDKSSFVVIGKYKFSQSIINREYQCIIQCTDISFIKLSWGFEISISITFYIFKILFWLHSELK